jgi:hypothetical protein
MIIAVAVGTKLFAQKPAVVEDNQNGWTHIGHTTASFKMQNESIVVLGADEFTALKLKITEATLDLERMQVFYESGEMEEIHLKDHFHENNETGVINLKHPDRDIKKVAFTYKTQPNAKGEKADIDLYGLKTGQPAGADSYRDEAAEVKEEAREAEQELNEEAREAERELDEETREAERDLDDDIEIEGEDDGRDVGDAIEEGAKDAAAAITDRKIKNKVGPGGETAYVDDDGKYYIINNLGEKQFVTKLQLKDKPDND